MGKIIYRLTNASEGKLFYKTDLYDNIIINGRLSTAQKAWMGTFLNKVKKGVYIDPQTYIYAINENNFLNGDDLKKSEEKYLELFPNEIKRILIEEKRTLEIEDFYNEEEMKSEFIKDFSRKIINIEKMHFRQNSLSAFLELIEDESKNEERSSLLAIIPPYFYFETPDDEWYKISLELAKETKNIEKENQVQPVLCFNKEILLDGTFIDRIVNDYSDFNSLFIHISDFEEKKIQINELIKLVEFLQKAKDKGITIINMYGNFFSYLMTLKKLLTGYSRGICYGSSKDIFSTGSGGGGMQNRYYFEINQTKLVESKARTLLSYHPEYKCDCTVCNDKDAPTIDEFFNTMENFDYRYHFMEKVHKIRTESINEIKQGLENSIDEINQKGLQNFGVTANHLKNWLEVFEHM